MFYSIDRISRNRAYLVAQDGTILEVSVKDITGNAKEGDVVAKHDEKYFIDENETKNKRRQIQEMLDNLLHSEKE